MGDKRGGIWWGGWVCGASAVEFGVVSVCGGQARWNLVGWVGVWGKCGGVWCGECVWGTSAVEFGGVGGCVGQARWSLVG